MRLIKARNWIVLLILILKLNIVGCADEEHTEVTESTSEDNQTILVNPEESHCTSGPKEETTLDDSSNKFQVVTDLKSQELEFYTIDDTLDSTDSGDQNKSKTNQTDKVELLRHRSDSAYLCLFKPGVKCTEFKYQGKTVWRYDPNLFDQSYPYSMYFKIYSRELTVWLNWKWYYIYSCSDDNKPYVLKYSLTDGKSLGVPTSTLTRPEASQVSSLETSFQTTPPKPIDSQQPKESTPAPEANESDQDQEGLSSTQVEDGSGTDPSQPTEETEDSQPASTNQSESLSQPTPTSPDSIITLAGDQESGSTPTEESGDQASEDQTNPVESSDQKGSSDSASPTSVPEASESSSPDVSDSSQPVEESDGSQPESSGTDSGTALDGTSGPDASLSSPEGSGDQEKEPEAVELNFKNKQDCDQYSYSLDKNTKTGAFVAKKGYLFNLVKQGEINVWDTKDPTQYSNKVFVAGIGSGKKNVTIYLLNGNTKYYRRRKKGYQWLDVTVSDDNDKIPMELNFSEEKSDEEFDYVKGNDGTASYIGKANFVFDRVFKPKGSCCCGSDAEIWVAKDKLYANKVVKDGIGTGKSLNNVSVYLTDGTVKSFIKKDKNWIEQSSIELNIKDTKTTYEFDCQKDDKAKTNTYVTKHGFKFSTVKHKDLEIWKSSSDSEHSTKVEVKLDGSNPKFVTIHLNNGTLKTYIKLDDKWFETPVGVGVDLKKTSSTDSFDVTKENKLTTYTPKLGVEFNLVKHDKTEIWKASGDSEYSTKVLHQDLGDNKADLTVHLNNGSIKKYHKPGKKDAWTHVSTSEVSTSDQTSSSNQSSQSSVSQPATPSTPGTDTQSVQLFVLDLRKKETCAEYEYVKDDSAKTQTYTAKAGHKFSQVKNGSADVWNPTDGKYGIKVTLTTDDKGKMNVKVDIDQSTPSSPSGGQTGSSEVKTTKVEHPSAFNITIDGTSTVNDQTKYELKQYDKVIKFIFKDKVKCTLIKYNDKEVWKLDAKIGKILKEIYFNSSTNMCFYSYFKTKYVYNYGDSWAYQSGTTDKKLSDSKFKVLTQGSDGSTKENNSGHYEEKNDGSFVKCEFKEGAKCVEINYDKQRVYKHDSSQHGGKHPKALYFHKHMKVLFVEFDNEAFVFVRLDENKWESEDVKKMENLDTNKFNTSSKVDKGEEKKNDTSVFEKKLMGPIVGFILKQVPNNFNVKYGDDLIFFFNKGSSKQPALKEMYFMAHSKKALLWLEDKCYYGDYESSEPIS